MNPFLHRLPLILTVLVLLALWVHGPVPQFADYHHFADTRVALGLPNAADILSNAGFALVGAWGLWVVWPARHRPGLAASWPAHILFLAALTLTALGSGYYHWAPDNARLVWDRLPIALACAGLLAGARLDTRGAAASTRETWLWTLGLALAAVFSVAWWAHTEAMGQGDLGPYLALQGLPLVLIPLWQALYRAPRADRVAYGVAIGLYAAAKVAELLDHELLALLGWMSGHTLKHLLATLAAAVLTHRLVQRAGGLARPALPRRSWRALPRT